MRFVPTAILTAAASLFLLPESSFGNLVLRRGGEEEDISALSIQLLDQTRTEAGRRKNVWDADPPVAAEAGFHYFLYNFDENGQLLPRGERPLTITGIAPGPGYRVLSFEVLVSNSQSETPQIEGQSPVRYFRSSLSSEFSTTYDSPDKPINLLSGFEEYGVARFSFEKIGDGVGTGNISAESDIGELAYDGLFQNNEFVRGDEHVRIFTDTLIGRDDDFLRGSMAATVRGDFIPGEDISFGPNGFLDFDFDGDGTIDRRFEGSEIQNATVGVVPEPSALALIGLAGLALRRRARVGTR